jgi:hypothetical protein
MPSGQYAYCLVFQLVCDMGRSPISNICSHVSLKHVSSWATQMDALMPAIEATYSAETREVLDRRREQMGAVQGRSFWGSCFTDDVILVNIGEEATIVATTVWDRTCYLCNIRMTDFVKRSVTTAPLHIGARFVINAHFGCVPTPKRVRCLEGIRAAVEGRALRDAFESNCGLIGHIAQTLALERPLLHGIKRPMDLALFPTSVVHLTADGFMRHLELEFLISSRNAASFVSAIPDASLTHQVPHAPTFSLFEIRMGSDACTGSDSVPNPAVFGMCHEFAYYFPLRGRWLDIPITGTETLGAILNFLVFPKLFPWARLVNETDASATHAFLIGRSKAPPLQRAHTVFRRQPEVREAALRSASQQVSGIQHVMVDAGSRGYDEILAGWLSALHMKLHLVHLSGDVLRVVDEVLEAMLLGEPSAAEFEDANPPGGVAFYDSAIEPIEYMDEEAEPPPSSPQMPSVVAFRAIGGGNRGSGPCPPQAPHPESPLLPPPTATRLGGAAPPAQLYLSRGSQSSSPTHQRPAPRPWVPSSPTLPPSTPGSSRGPPASPPSLPRDPVTDHERPRTAAAFRALGAVRLADRLCNDSSPWALLPSDPSMLRQTVSLIAQTQAKRIPVNTERGNNNGIRWFADACKALNTPVERPDAAHADPEVEAFLQAYVIFRTAQYMKPAERSAVTQLGNVRKTRADPNSAVSALYGARRVLEDFGSYLPPMTSVLKCLKGLRVMMIEDFGDDCFAKEQAQPWPQIYLDKVMHFCSTYQVPGWAPDVHEAFLDAFVHSLSTGNRKAELLRYMLSNISWLTPDLEKGDGSPEWLAQVTEGWWCCMAPTCSKTDFDNTKYGSTRMWFRVCLNEPWSLAGRLLARERRHPVPASERVKTRLFLDPQTGAGVTSLRILSWLDTILSLCVPSDVAARITWHSGRVTLASKLVKIDKPWERISTLIRWEGVASARIYGRAAAQAYHDDIMAALAADAKGVRLPGEIDPVSAMDQIDAALSEPADKAEANAAAKRTAAAELRNEPKKTPKAKLTRPPVSDQHEIQLADGTHATCGREDSWNLVGQEITIPEAAWTYDDWDKEKFRYRVAGLSYDTGEPIFVVTAVSPSIAGSSYLASAKVVKRFMTTEMRNRAGPSLARAPTLM